MESLQEEKRVTRRVWAVLGVISTVRFFLQFDQAITTYAMPFLGKTFGSSSVELASAVAIAGIGNPSSFVLSVAADRYGRKRIMMLSFFGLTIGIGLTGLSNSIWQWALLQCISRFFLFGAITMCYVIVAEEMPANMRGRGSGFEHTFGGFGNILAALILPLALSQSWMGEGQGWRTMYLLALFALPIVVMLRYVMKETRRFQQVKDRRDGKSIVETTKVTPVSYRALLERRYLKFVIILVIGWLGFQVPYGVTTLLHVFTSRERGWDAEMISTYGTIIAIAGMVGNNVRGLLVDKLGRRRSGLIMFSSSGVFSTLFLIVPGYTEMLAMGSIQSLIGSEVILLNVLANEFFPTEIRATGVAVIMGVSRFAMMGSPMLFGYLVSAGFSLSQGLIMTHLPWSIISLTTVMLFLPETKNKSLEDIHEIVKK